MMVSRGKPRFRDLGVYWWKIVKADGCGLTSIIDSIVRITSSLSTQSHSNLTQGRKFKSGEPDIRSAGKFLEKKNVFCPQ
jgi:hypothetical protein